MSLPEWIAFLMLGALVVYCLSGGADFGGGLWDLLAFGQNAKAERRLIASALSPIWEANHVWLILIVTLLFTCFPKAYAAISIALHIPLTLMLIGIVMRGAAFTFRSYGNLDRPAAHRWGVVFAVASIVTPVTLGAMLATLSTGGVPHFGNSFADGYDAWEWCRPFPLCVGFFTLSLFALLAAVYLTDETEDRDLQNAFRARALAAAFCTAGLALLSFWLSGEEAPRIERGLSDRQWSAVLHVVTGIAALGTFVALYRRRFSWARVLAILQVASIVFGWGFSQYPYLIVSHLTIEQAAATPAMLKPVLIVLLIGSAILIPSFIYLFRIFKSEKKGRLNAGQG